MMIFDSRPPTLSLKKLGKLMFTNREIKSVHFWFVNIIWPRLYNTKKATIVVYVCCWLLKQRYYDTKNTIHIKANTRGTYVFFLMYCVFCIDISPWKYQTFDSYLSFSFTIKCIWANIAEGHFLDWKPAASDLRQTATHAYVREQVLQGVH